MREKLQLKPEELLLLLAADIQPEPDVLNRMNDLLLEVRHWDALTKMVIDRAAAPLLMDKLPKLSNAALLPSSVLDSLKQASLRTLSRNMLLTAHFRHIVQIFSQVDIPVLALKGAMLSEWLYGNINLRQFSDLDLLVPESHGFEAITILENMGYLTNRLTMSEFIKSNTSTVHYAPMVKNGVSVEIHIHIHAQTEDYHVDLPAMWDRAVPLKLHGEDVLGFCPEDLLLHLCIHLDKHFRIGHFQFTCLYDLTNMLNHKADLIHWEEFEKRCIEANAVNETYKYLILVHKYFNANLPASVYERYANLLIAKEERMFLSVLRGKFMQDYTSSVLRSVSKLDGFGSKFRYVFDVFFPSTTFMMQRYRLKRKSQIWLYYFYRMYSGFNGLLMSLKKNIS